MITAPPRHPAALAPAWAVVVVGVLVALGWTAAMLWLAYPRHDICPAILPAPPGCGDRMDLAWPWIAGVWGALAVLLLVLRGGRQRPSLQAAALLLVLTVGAVGYRTVHYLGFTFHP